MVGCPRCGSHVVFMEMQYIGLGIQILQWCRRRRCGHWWFDDKTPKQWKFLSIIKGRKLCLVEELPIKRVTHRRGKNV